MTWCRPWALDLGPMEVLRIVDYGDCQFDFGAPETVTPFIEKHIDGILEGGAACLAMGGDHYISYPVLRSYEVRQDSAEPC